MHYFIYADKDTTIYHSSQSRQYAGVYDNEQNTGLDSVIELQSSVPPSVTSKATSRMLVSFDLTTSESTGSKYYLRLYDCHSEGIALTQNINAHRLTSDWEMGLGRYHDTPFVTDGATWDWADVSGSVSWVGGSYSNDYVASQSLEFKTTDLKLDVSDIVKKNWIEASDGNYGFLLKRPNTEETNSVGYGSLKFFSRDTNTIYPPKLEVCIDDFSWDQGITGSYTALPEDDYTVYMKNYDSEFKEGAKVRFRVLGRSKHHVASNVPGQNKSFTKYYLPSGSSYYSIKDTVTEETLIDFDEYTTLSGDSNGNYFDVNMNGLQPERYYRFVFKVVDPTTKLTKFFDRDFTFKVVR